MWISTLKPVFDHRPVHVRFVGTSGTETGPPPREHCSTLTFTFQTALIRRKSGRSRGSFKQSSYLSDIGECWTDRKHFHIALFSPCKWWTRLANPNQVELQQIQQIPLGLCIASRTDGQTDGRSVNHCLVEWGPSRARKMANRRKSYTSSLPFHKSLQHQPPEMMDHFHFLFTFYFSWVSTHTSLFMSRYNLYQ